MKKHSFFGRFFSLLTLLSLLVGMVPLTTTAAGDTWDQSYLISQSVAAYGAPVSALGDSIEYTMLTGDFFGSGELHRFSVMSNAMLGSDSLPVCVWPWQIKVTGGADFVVKITAKQNLYLRLWQYADTVSNWVGNTQIAYAVENQKGIRVTLKTLELTVNEAVTTAQYDTHLHLKAGDTAYIIYHKTDAYSATYPSNMRITVDTSAFDVSQRTYFPKEVSTFAHTDMVSAEVAAAGASVKAENVTYQFLYGDLETGRMTAFTQFGGNGSGGADDIVGDAGSDNAVWRWQWRAGNVHDTMLKLTATENIKLTMSHPNSIPEGSIWAFHSEFILYTADAKGRLVQLADYPVEKPMNTAAVKAELHMEAGDCIYLVYRLKDYADGQVTAGLMPYFTADPTAYDAAKRTVFPAPPENMQHPDMVSREVSAGGAAVAGEIVTYQFLYGKFNTGVLNAFTQFGGNGSGGADDIVGDAEGDNAVWRWQWRAGKDYDTVLRITANRNVKLSLSNPNGVPEENIWAFHSRFCLYTQNKVGTQVLLADYPVDTLTQPNSADISIHMAAGDSLYIVYTMDPGHTGIVVNEFIPYYSLEQAAYNPRQRTDFGNEDPVGYVEKWGLKLKDSIGVDFRLTLRTESADALVTVGGKQTVFPGVTDGQQISIALAAAQMTDTITLQLVDANGTESEAYHYSIRQYADTILAGDYDDATKNLVKAMLSYGGKAQLLFDYNANNLADAGITTELLTVPETTSPCKVMGAAPGIRFQGATLLFQDRTAVRLYFRVEDAVTDHTFTVGTKTYIPIQKDDLYYIELEGLSPADLDESYTVTVDGTLTVTYSPMDYIFRMYHRDASSGELKAALQAMYAYFLAAEAYLPVQRQSKLYGMCYIAYEGMGNGIDYRKGFRLMSNLGVKSIRHWMHITWFIDQDFQVIEENVALMKDIIAEAQKYDIQLIGMSHRNINKYGPQHENSKVGRDSDYYAQWIANYEKGWYMLAKLFPEITVWEIDNETNNVDFMADAEGGSFTQQEMADISTDMFYYGSRGIHRANPDATTVMGGFVTWGDGLFLDRIYQNIASGNFGEGSTDPDDYFQALAWHPYMVVFDAEEFIRINQQLYATACRYEGKEKTVYFTELGGWDEFLNQSQSAQYLTQLYTQVASQLPFVETMHYFRAFDNVVDNGNQFGMFADPNPEREDISNGEYFSPGMPKLTAYAYQAAAGGEGSLELLLSKS